MAASKSVTVYWRVN